MTLYMIGIGLDSERDITVRGLEAVRKCKTVYLEDYTSKLGCGIGKLEELYNKKVILADRNMVEKKADDILEKAKNEDVAFLVIGDVFSATTHTDLKLRAVKKGVDVKIIHNASVLTAIGNTGLELYKFGKVTSIPFENKNIKTPYEVLEMNKGIGLHTLFLLDIESEKKRYMTLKEALCYLLDAEDKEKKGLVSQETVCVGCAGLGSEKEKIRAGTAKELMKEEFEGLQCLIIPGKLHFIEEEALKQIRLFPPKYL